MDRTQQIYVSPSPPYRPLSRISVAYGKCFPGSTSPVPRSTQFLVGDGHTTPGNRPVDQPPLWQTTRWGDSKRPGRSILLEPVDLASFLFARAPCWHLYGGRKQTFLFSPGFPGDQTGFGFGK